MKRPLKILVAGYVIGFPLGGMAWVLLHYLLGLKKLGHEVLFIEDSGDWSYPFNPWTGTYGVDSSYGRKLLDDLMGRFGLAGRWAYASAMENRLYGMADDDFDRFAKNADLFLNISGVVPLRERYMHAPVRAFVDTDPVFTQVRGAIKDSILDYYQAHNVHFTFGWNLPRGNTPLPLLGIDWRPTVPPVDVSLWEPLPGKGRAYTTIGSWDTKDRDIVLDDARYSWRKSIQYEKFIDLPMTITPQVPFELSYSGMERSEARYLAHGWVIRDGMRLSRDIWGYRDYIRSSRAEFTVAKDQNIILKSGWFSDRSACYLASGRPVITQDCGIGTYLPLGEGLFTFETKEEIVAAVRAVEADSDRHRHAARRIAEEYLDAPRVLSAMLKEMDLA